MGLMAAILDSTVQREKELSLTKVSPDLSPFFCIINFPHHLLGKCYHSPHFTDEDTETLRD